MTAAIDESTETTGVEFDAQHFDNLVTNAIGDPDDIANENANEDVAAAITYYRSLTAAGRTAARRYLESDAKDKVLQGAFAEGQSILVLADRIKKPITRKRPSRSRSTPRPARNRTIEVAAHIAAIQLGYSLAMLDAHNDQTLDLDWQDKIAKFATPEAQEAASQYAQWLRDGQVGPEPEAADVEKAAARISLGRAPKGAGRKPKTATRSEFAPIPDRAPKKNVTAPEPESPERIDQVAAAQDDAVALLTQEM